MPWEDRRCRFPIIYDGFEDSQTKIIKRGMERGGATALFYHFEERCSEGEVEEWLRRRRIREEKKVLIVDSDVSRGWEASHILVVSLMGGNGLENLVMRTVGYSTLVRAK